VVIAAIKLSLLETGTLVNVSYITNNSDFKNLKYFNPDLKHTFAKLWKSVRGNCCN